MYEFAKEAKRHGLLYVSIRDKANPDMIEIAIWEDDAADDALCKLARAKAPGFRFCF